MRVAWLPLLIAGVVAATAQDRISAPRIGSMLTDGQLTEIIGVPGAARFGTTRPTSYLQLIPASHARVSLAIASDRLVLLGATRAELLIDSSASFAAISPRGSHIAYLTPAALVIRDLTTSEPSTITRESIGITDSVQSIAVSDSGLVLLSTDHKLIAAGPHTTGTSIDSGLSISFLPGSDQAVAYDARRLLLIDGATLNTITAAEASITGLALSGDASTIWLATADPELLAYSLADHTVARHEMPSSGTLRLLGAPDVFLWSASALLDTRRPRPQVLLIASEVH